MQHSGCIKQWTVDDFDRKWSETGAVAARSAPPGLCLFEGPVPEARIAAVEAELGLRLPEQLRHFYLRWGNAPGVPRLMPELGNFDGLKEMFEQWGGRLVPAFDPGTGDLYGYAVLEGVVHADLVLLDHEESTLLPMECDFFGLLLRNTAWGRELEFQARRARQDG